MLPALSCGIALPSCPVTALGTDAGRVLPVGLQFLPLQVVTGVTEQRSQLVFPSSSFVTFFMLSLLINPQACDKVVNVQKPAGEMDGEAARILPWKSLIDFKTNPLTLERQS